MKLAGHFGHINQVRRDRLLTHDELIQYASSILEENKHESRSERHIYIPIIILLDNPQREGFYPFFTCQTRVRDVGKREHTEHVLRLCREDQINHNQMPGIILLNNHSGSSSYRMLPGLFRSVCCNGLVCGESFDEVWVPHRDNVMEKVTEGAYEVLSVFDQVEGKRDVMQSLMLSPPAQQALVRTALTYCFDEEYQPVMKSRLLTPRRWQDEPGDLWTTYRRIQENLIKGGLDGRAAKGGRTYARAIRGIDNDIKLNCALQVMAENMLQLAS